MTRLLLDALEALGVLQGSDDGRYSTTTAASWLIAVATGWSHLDHILPTGQPIVSADTPAGAAEFYPEVVPMLSTLLAPAGRRAAELLTPVGGEVLDVGAGAAPWSITLAAADPTAQVTALDLPEVLHTTRRAVQAAGLAGRFRFHAGEIVVPGLLAANRDEACAGQPHALDITRAPNPHLTFGYGIHHCLGAPLARLEGRIALGRLLARFPGLQLAEPPEELSWRPGVLMHGLTALPVVLD